MSKFDSNVVSNEFLMFHLWLCMTNEYDILPS